MSQQADDDVRDAVHGQKMIEVKVRFWTNELAPKDQVRPKHGWTRGVLRMTPNETHGIESARAIPFNSLMELPGKIEELLIEHDITLHLVAKQAKYVEG